MPPTLLLATNYTDTELERLNNIPPLGVEHESINRPFAPHSCPPPRKVQIFWKSFFGGKFN